MSLSSESPQPLAYPLCQYSTRATDAAVSVLLACLPDFSPLSLSHRRNSDLPRSESGLLVLAGTFTDVTKQAGPGNDSGSAMGAAFGDYDRDGWADLFVAHDVDFHLDDLPAFGSRTTCKASRNRCPMRPCRAHGFTG